MDLFPDFSILSHCHCQYQNGLTMEVLPYILIYDVPSSLILLFFHGIPGYSCLFVLPSGLYLNNLNLFIRENRPFMMLSLLNQVHDACFNFSHFLSKQRNLFKKQVELGFLLEDSS